MRAGRRSARHSVRSHRIGESSIAAPQKILVMVLLIVFLSKVFIVLVPTMDADTSKANEARKKKLTLMTPEVFTKKYL